MLRPSRDGRLDPCFLDVFVKHAHGIIDDLLTCLALLLHLSHEVSIFLRMQVVEAEILQFPLDVIDPQAVCQRSVDLDRFMGDADLLFPPEDA